MGYSHLSMDERESIAQNLAAGCSLTQIAAALGRAVSTITRELARNTLSSGAYSPYRAQRSYLQRRAAASPPWRLEGDEALRQAVQAGLEQHWSPEQIAGRLRREHRGRVAWRVGFKTIYRWLERDRTAGGQWFRLLRQGGGHYRKKHGRRGRQGQIPGRRLLKERPAIAQRRGRRGDFESDTICAGRRPMMVTHVDRKSRYLVAAPVPNGSPVQLNRATLKAFEKIPSRLRHTLTVDNGREFMRHQELESALGVRIYFAPPFQSWQRGTNENTNGLLREFFPKEARQRPSRKTIDRVTRLLNNRPRKCLSWRTPAEVFGEPG